MKRIGIITFHSAENYGAFLQTYASQNYLERLYPEFDIKVVDYRPWYIKNAYKLYFPKRSEFNCIKHYLRSFTINLLFTPNRLKRKIKFKKSLKYLTLTSKYKKDNWNEKFDYLYLGSDQIWNARITKGVDPVYYGDISNDSSRKIAYAASLGGERFSQNEEDLMKQYLSNIERISVRENTSINYLKKLFDTKYEVVIDPTLLLEKNFWKKRIKQTINEKKYVVIFEVNHSKNMYRDACKFAKENNLSVVCLNELGRKYSMIDGVKIKSYSALAPFEFLGAIHGANCVFTDSFHGTCFSILFERDFFTYLSEKRNSRIIDLCKTLGLEDRIVKYLEHINQFKEKKHIDYQKVEYLLTSMREHSKEYLIDSFKRSQNE